jgi:PTH1 family peptidyl-tRNA hydrolase
MIFIGLQNAEEKYSKTRHNAGAIVLNYLVAKDGNKFVLDKYTNSFKYGNFYLPNTFMNLSGESVQKIVKNEKIETKDLFVLVDDVTIPVGNFKISIAEGASSHNGIKSIIENLGGANDFTRVRIGVGKIVKDANGVERMLVPGPDKLADFVLSNLNNIEIAQIQGLGEKIISTISI